MTYNVHIRATTKSGWRYNVDWNLMTHANWKVNTPMQQSVDLVTEAIIVYVIKHAITGKFFDFSFLTLFLPKTNIFVHSKNCTFSKKGLGHKGRCYSVCNDDTCKWTSHILSRIIGPSNTATKIGVPISDTGHMAQISTANPEILINFHACSCKVY